MSKLNGQGRLTPLGEVSRMLVTEPDLFDVHADPLSLVSASSRFPSGRSIVLAGVPELRAGLLSDDMEAERWDGLS